MNTGGWLLLLMMMSIMAETSQAFVLSSARRLMTGLQELARRIKGKKKLSYRRETARQLCMSTYRLAN